MALDDMEGVRDREYELQTAHSKSGGFTQHSVRRKKLIKKELDVLYESNPKLLQDRRKGWYYPENLAS